MTAKPDKPAAAAVFTSATMAPGDVGAGGMIHPPGRVGFECVAPATWTLTSVLPPALALAKEVELLPERVLKLTSEAQVRDLVEDLNERIRYAQRQPQEGPSFRVRTVNVDAAVERWRVD